MGPSTTRYRNLSTEDEIHPPMPAPRLLGEVPEVRVAGEGHENVGRHEQQAARRCGGHLHQTILSTSWFAQPSSEKGSCGAISRSGFSTNARSRMRGCGTCSVAVLSCAAP